VHISLLHISKYP